MIQVLPMEDREKEKERLNGLPVGKGEPRVLEMTDRGEVMGWAAVELDRGVLRILQLRALGYDGAEPPKGEVSFVLDTLMRSAASYGEHSGAGFLETAFPDFFGFFQARGFEVDETHAFTPMSTIVKYE